MSQGITGDKNTPAWWQADDKVEAYLLAKHEETLRELAEEWYGGQPVREEDL